MSKRRVVVTGLGALTPLALNVDDTWKKILAGVSGVRPVDEFDVTDYPTKITATTKGFDPSGHFSMKEARKVDVFVLYAGAAAQQALQDSGLTITDEMAERVGVAIGSGIGGLPSMVKNQHELDSKGPRRVSPFFIPGTIINMAAGYTAIKINAKGPNISIVTACTTGSHNIGYAARTIAYGDADVMFAGGAEMATTPLGLSGFSALRALSTRNDEPTKASRPWDRDRDGFILADGAGVLVLEEYEHAKARGAHIYAELAGFGMSADAFHFTMPDQSGMERAMINAIKDAHLHVTDIDYINAHATSTPAGDIVEAGAIKKVFGEHAYKLCVSSTKSMTGHLLGAAGAVEAIFSILALRDQVAPPTINLDNPSEGCDLDFVAHTAQQRKLKVVISNSFGFGGTNGCLLFKSI